jgi:acetaldehyde dehydrogenase/alcohol dehydrogenase
MTALFADIPLEPAGVPRGRAMVERAEWAARAFATFDIDTVRRIAKAAAEAGEQHATEFAEAAVAETGFGVAEHKVLKNVACSIGIWNTYGSHDYVSPVVREDQRIVEIPRPAGVVFALTPSTNPVATTYFKIMLALLTRNAIIVSPHPYAKRVCTDAARVMRDASRSRRSP